MSSENGIMLKGNEDGTWSMYQEPYATIECVTEEDYNFLQKAVEEYKKCKWHDLRDTPDSDKDLLIKTKRGDYLVCRYTEYGFEYLIPSECTVGYSYDVIAWRYIDPLEGEKE